MKKMIMACTLIISVFAMTGCNTFSGFGQDVSAGGKAITNSADKVKSDM